MRISDWSSDVCSSDLGVLPVAALALAMALPGTASAANADDTITLGAVVSLTGSYSTNGKFTRDGYNLAVDRINSTGGIKVGGKTYKLAIKYRSEERRVGKECVSTCRSRRSQ